MEQGQPPRTRFFFFCFALASAIDEAVGRITKPLGSGQSEVSIVGSYAIRDGKLITTENLFRNDIEESIYFISEFTSYSPEYLKQMNEYEFFRLLVKAKLKQDYLIEQSKK